ncbi:MAG: HYC_CC_PP family protein [Flavobacteriales bacterium]
MSDQRHNKPRIPAYISFVKSAFSIFLATLVLVATSGVGITKHICGNRIASVSVTGDAGCTCGEMDDASNCCHSERQFFQLDDDFSVAPVQSLNLSAATILAVVAYNLSFDLLVEEGETEYLNYKPPIPDKDIPVLIQSFLI